MTYNSKCAIVNIGQLTQGYIFAFKDQHTYGGYMADYKDIKFKVDEFAMRGLNKYRNFLSSPTCDDCGSTGYLQFETDHDVYEFCTALIGEHGCYDSAIFMVFKDGTQRIALANPEYNEDAEEVTITGVHILQDQDINAFAKLDADLRLCCYGLIIERDNGWEICE